MNLNRRLIAFSVGSQGLLALAVAAGFLAGLGTVGQAWLLSQALGRVFLEGQTLPEVWELLGALLALAALRAGMGFIVETAASAAAARIKDQVRAALLGRLIDLGPVALSGERSGEIANTVTQGVDAMDAYFSQYLPQLLLAGLLPVAYLAVILPIDPLSGLALLLTGPLIPVFMYLTGAQSQRLTRKQWAALGHMSAYFLDTLQGLVVLKTLGRSREQAGRIAEVSERYRQTTLSAMRLTFLSALTLELLSTIGTAVAAVQIGLRLLYGGVAFAPAFFVLLMAPEFYLPLRALGLRFHASMSGLSAAQRIFAILDLAPAAPGTLSEARETPGPAPLALPLEIQVDDVHYTYPARAGEAHPSSAPALRGVTFTLHSGQQVALVGASGAGKSTLASLLLGFMPPQRGQIRVNGVPLRALDPRAWRSQIAWVPQNPYLFHDTLAANLRLGRPGAALEDLRRAARAVDLDRWIESLPRGYETVIGEGGARLSGGQGQRLAVARALLRDAPLLVLDEPTAYLDVEQEEILQSALSRLSAGRSVVVIAHRLRTALRADQVVVLEGGQVVEMGAPAAL